MRRCFGFLLLWLLALPAALAEEVAAEVYGQRDEMTLRSGETDVDTRITRLGVVLTGIYNPHLDGSLDIGHADLTQTDNPATQGMSLTGQYLGVALRVWPLRSAYLDAWLQGDYTYYSLSDGIAGQETAIDWQDRGLAAGVVAHMGRVDLHGGVRRGHLSGDEVANGTLTYTRGVSRTDDTSAWLGLYLHVEPGGTIGAMVERGGRRSVSVRFAYGF